MGASANLAVLLLALLGAVSGAPGRVQPSRAQQIQHLLNDNWLQYGQSFYKQPAGEATWHEARAVCHQMHHLADLMTIHDFNEQVFLTSHFPGRQWIGLNDLAVEGFFSWVSGAEVDFTYWGPDQPDNDQYGQDCVNLTPLFDDMWDDEDCDVTRPFVCKVDLG